MIKYLLGRASTGKFRFAVVECDEEWHSDGDVHNFNVVLFCINKIVTITQIFNGLN